MAADGAGAFPFSTIPGLPPASNVSISDEFWVNQSGADRRATVGDVVALAAGGQFVTSVTSADSNLSVANATSTPVLTVIAAPKWATARNLTFTGDATGLITIDGSANASGALTLAAANATPGTFGSAAAIPQFTVDAKGRITSATSIPVTIGSGTVTSISSTTGDLGVVNPTTTPALTVLSAPRWTTPRVVQFTGDVTGTNTVDGSANVSTALTIAPSGVTAGTYGDATHIPAVTVNAKGLVTGVTLVPTPPAVGTVTSVGLTAPAMFTVSNSPITSAGNLGLALASQPQSTFLGAPNGAAGVPSFRTLTTQDLPPGTGTVTSVGLSMPSLFGVGGSPVTGSGTLTVFIPNQGQNSVWAGPVSGGSGQPTFRALTLADLPPGLGTVTSVGLALPSMFVVTGSPVTGAGTLSASLQGQAQATVLAAPAGSAGVPSFRALVASDIPSLSGSYLPLTGGVVNGPVSVFGGGGANALAVDGPAGTVRQFNLNTAGLNRWRVGATSTAESGANAGSDLAIQSFTDAGANLAVPISINRATGVVSLSAVPSLPSQVAGSVFAAPAGAAGVPSFRALTAADIPSLSGTYLPLAGGTVTGPTTFSGAFTNGVTPTWPVQGQGVVWASLRAGSGTGNPAFRTLDPGDFTANAPSNQVLAGPNGVAGVPLYRRLVGADLPNPAAASLGGVQSATAAANNFMTGISTVGVPTFAQPSSANLSDTVGRTAWTPVATFATPGDSTFAYSALTAFYMKVGGVVTFWARFNCTPTYTTASGALQISLPLQSLETAANGFMFGIYRLTGATWPSGATQIAAALVPPGNIFTINGFGSALAATAFATTNFPSGTQFQISMSGTYF